jgi:predicted 3-demethylubiquinone-9 3-methyltransferase (glyoxalase superfamily)
MNTTLCSLLFSTAVLLPAAVVPSAVRQEHPTVAARSKITPCLWFPGDAEDALRCYLATFAGAKLVAESRSGGGGPLPEGALHTAVFEVDGQRIMVLNGNPARGFTPAVSLCVRCDSQAEIDRLWRQLTAGGGAPGRCGWLQDRFGVSWQIVPAELEALLDPKDPARARRVGAALLQMDKLDVARLEQAAAGR